MNNFIIAEQFLNQSEKVQSELIKWWMPSIGDLYSCSNTDYVKVIDEDVLAEYEINGSLKETIYCFNSKEDVVFPLLQVHQLINFIENKIGKVIRMDMWEYKNKIMTEIEIPAFDIFHKETSPLQTLWEITIKLIESEVL